MQRITALVTSAHHPTALGAAQALRTAGADVVGFSHQPDDWCCRSRAWREVVGTGDSSPARVLDHIIDTAERIDGPVYLLPAADRLVLEISRRRDCLPENVRTTLPEDPTVELLMEKTRFARWAQERGYPVPRSLIVTSEDGLRAALERIGFPALLKPTIKTALWQKNSPVEKAFRLDRPTDLDAISFDLFAAADAYLVSEWITGADDDVLFCLAYLDRNSDMVASFTGRKLLQYPRLTGSTAICVDRPDPELEELTRRLFKETGCHGMASLEVKRAGPGGRYLITEPTVGRPNLQSGAAVLSGVNLHGIAMRDAWELDFQDLIGPRRPCLWVEERALFGALRSESRAPKRLGMVMRQAMAKRRFGGAYFRVRDHRPFTSMAGNWILRGFRRVLRRPGTSRLPDAAPE